eukprot:GHRR01005354.1.p1 GENE.GHRR01005354.1~~GHRR01005354.1.p1  ORF type:complete len:220 (+),score=46.05 GHRR01005354.1:261-920(+)
MSLFCWLQAMVSANYKLVMSISRKYQGYGIPLGDLVNEGIAGLVKGVERFEPSKGCKFSTYAHWWIRQSITRSLSDQGRLVRLPSHMQELMTKMTKISRQYEAQYGRDPTLGELAKELGVDTSKIQDAYEAVFTPKSLDAPMADGEGATLGELVEVRYPLSYCLGPGFVLCVRRIDTPLAHEKRVLRCMGMIECGVVRLYSDVDKQHCHKWLCCKQLCV